MALIRTHKLNTKVEIQQFTKSKNEFGEWSKSWETILHPWASVKQQYLRDYERSIGTILEGTLTFVIRYQQRAEIATDMRIKWKGKTYEIINIMEDEFNREFTTIVAKQVSEDA